MLNNLINTPIDTIKSNIQNDPLQLWDIVLDKLFEELLASNQNNESVSCTFEEPCVDERELIEIKKFIESHDKMPKCDLAEVLYKRWGSSAISEITKIHKEMSAEAEALLEKEDEILPKYDPWA